MKKTSSISLPYVLAFNSLVVFTSLTQPIDSANVVFWYRTKFRFITIL